MILTNTNNALGRRLATDASKKTRVLISLLYRMRGAIEGTGGPWTPNNFIWAKPQTPISPKTTIRPTYFFRGALYALS